MQKNIRQSIILFSILLLGLSFRIMYLIRYPIQPRDSYVYFDVIANWENSDFIPNNMRIHQMSLYILKIPLHVWGYNLAKGGIIVNMLLGLLLIAFTMILAERLFDNKVISAFAGVISATHPTLIIYSCSFLTENTFLFFYMGSIVCLTKHFTQNSFGGLFLASILCSISFFCRIEGLELIAIATICMFYQVLCKKKKIKEVLKNFIIFISFFVISSNIICFLFSFKPILISDVTTRTALLWK